MSARHQLRVEAEANRGRVHLDGQDVSNALRGLHLDLHPHSLPSAELDVLVHVAEVDGQDVVVSVPPGTHDLLVHLGWTPPEAP